VWAGVGLSLLLHEVNGFWSALTVNTARGDLFLLAAAAIAPLTLYLSVRRNDLPKPLTVHFPGGWFFIVSLVLVFGICTALFAIKRVADLPNTPFHIDHDLFLLISFVTYVSALVISLVVTTIANSLDDFKAEDLFREDERSAISAWKRRRKK
jgi:Ca2+/Na+ antiporter